jgi:hypothetical protein
MPPTDRFVISFAAEPPQEALPYGRWADTLREHFVAACEAIETDEAGGIGKPGEVRWFPDRTYAGRTYVPAVSRTELGYELFGFVSFREGGNGAGPSDFEGHADFTGDVAEHNPDWKLDLNSWTIASWRGENGHLAEIALVWGVPLVPGGVIVTGELASLAVDQCQLIEERFTLIAADSYRGDYLDVKLWSQRGHELAVEALYDEADEDDESDASDLSEESDEDEDPRDSRGGSAGS